MKNRQFRWRLWDDFGVSALLTLTTTLGTIFTLAWLGLHDDVDGALKLSAPLILLTTRFWEGYLEKRKREQENGNPKPAPDPKP